MTSPHDQIDDWLEHSVTPLYPPPGALDRVRRRARQRKTRQATVAAAGCAVVLAGAVVTPQLIATGQHSGHHGPPPVAVGLRSRAVQPSPSNSAAPLSGKATKVQQGQRTTLTKSWTRPPAHFKPTSVTFVGTGTGGVIGAVIGQAGPPCASQDCTSLAATSDYGHTWKGVSAPYAPAPTGAAGVSQLRFANLSDGWAYGPALYETSHGGWPWEPESTDGQHVIDVEAVTTRAFAVFGTCSGTGTDYAAKCTSFSLWTSVAGSRTWTPVQVPAAYQQLTSTSSASSAAPKLVIAGGTTAYLLTPSGELLSGPTSGGSWQAVGKAPCSPGPGSASGQASPSPSVQASGTQSSSPAPSAGIQGSASQRYGAEFASGTHLVLSCQSLAAAGQVAVYTSTDGARWHRAGSMTVSGTPTSLASAANGQAVLATTAGIDYSANGGRTWLAATYTGAGSVPPGGFRYVGMTNATQGVAIPAGSSLGEVYVTADGGSTWSKSPITG